MREGGAEVITAENCALVLSISMALSPSEIFPNTAGPQRICSPVDPRAFGSPWS